MSSSFSDLSLLVRSCEKAVQEGRYGPAESGFKQILARFPTLVDCRVNLGVCQIEQKKYKEAVETLKLAVKTDPTCHQAHSNLGVAYKILGDFERAEKCLRRAVDIKPDFGDAWWNLVEMRKQDPTLDSHRERAIKDNRTLMQEEPDENESHLRFALAKLYADFGEHDLAFSFYEKANRLSGIPPINEAEYAEFVLKFREWFTRERIERISELVGDPTPKPVFVVGCPRSGTTLVESILDAHPRVKGCGERTKLFESRIFIHEKLGGEYPECLEDLDITTAFRAQTKYLDGLTGDFDRWVDKMPANFAHLGLARILFPNCSVIHVRRNPLDNCLSIFFQRFRKKLPFSADLRSIGIYHRCQELLMDHWKSIMDDILEVDYEDVVALFGNELGRMLNYLDLPMAESCLQFHKTSRTRETNAESVTQPIHTKRVGRWKNYETHLGVLKEALEWSPEDALTGSSG